MDILIVIPIMIMLFDTGNILLVYAIGIITFCSVTQQFIRSKSGANQEKSKDELGEVYKASYQTLLFLLVLYGAIDTYFNGAVDSKLVFILIGATVLLALYETIFFFKNNHSSESRE